MIKDRLVKVSSSNINSVEFRNEDGKDGDLIVEYLGSGRKYLYESVPESVFEKLLEADSKGRFMNTDIKGNYKYKLLEEGK